MNMNKFNCKLRIKVSYLIFIIFCLIGCAYHIAQVIKVYLTFQTKIDVSFDSTSQIVVPLVSFCKPRFALMINESLRDHLIVLNTTSTPAEIDKSTFGFKDIFLFCRYLDRNGYYGISYDCQLANGFQIEKTVNHFIVCYNFKHPQFIQKDRVKGTLYEFWIYHHHQTQYNLYLSSDHNAPNGLSTNTLRLISNDLLIHNIIIFIVS